MGELARSTAPLLFACLGATIARREDHRLAFAMLDDGFDFEAQRKAKELAGYGWQLDARDLYPDALGCLVQLSSVGYRLGIAGNQPAAVERALIDAELPVEFVRSSEALGASKPAPVFFERIVELASVPAERIAYVGDPADNDVLPAHRAGIVTVFIRRGPWGYIHATWPEIRCATSRSVRWTSSQQSSAQGVREAREVIDHLVPHVGLPVEPDLPPSASERFERQAGV